jgi:long-chain acyl-CoA synthetase
VERIWLKSYPPGVPAEIDASRYASLVGLFEQSVREFASRPAYYSMGKTISYGELDRLSRDFAAWLQAKGLAKGARVAIMMPNCLQYPVAMFGTLRAGCTVVNVNPLYTARELEHQLRDSGAEAMVILENFAAVLQQVRARTPLKHVVVTSLGEMLGLKGVVVNLVVRKVKKMVPPFDLPGAISLKQALDEGKGKPLTTPRLTQDDIAFLQYTGGTTGVSKGAILLHRNILANVEQASAWLLPGLANEPAVIITALPLYHIFSLTVNCLLMMKIGGLNILITNPRDIPGFVKELAKHKYSIITGVNTLYNALLILSWEAVIPDISISVWFTFLAMMIVINRIPFLPSKDLLFLGASIELSRHLEVATDSIAGMLLVYSVLGKIFNLIVFLLINYFGRDPDAKEAPSRSSTRAARPPTIVTSSPQRTAFSPRSSDRMTSGS